jgi:hypothetical protein
MAQIGGRRRYATDPEFCTRSLWKKLQAEEPGSHHHQEGEG